MTTKQEGIIIELQGIIDDLKEAKHWGTIDRLVDHLQTVKDALEVEL